MEIMKKIWYLICTITFAIFLFIGYNIESIFAESISCDFLKLNHYGKYIISDGEIRYDYYVVAHVCGEGINMWAGTYS